MKNELIVSLISILILSTTASVAFADVIEPGMKEVKFYYTILNTNNYPDYVFLIHGTPSPPYEIINSSEFSFYKSSTVSIYAIKKSDFNKIELSNMSSSEIDKFFNNDPRVIKSDIKLEGSYKQVSINDPLEKATVVLNITSLNQNEMNSSNTSVWGAKIHKILAIQKTKVIFTYADGKSQEEIFKDQNITPEPSSKTDWIPELGYIVIPIVAIIAIAIILISRKFK